MRHWKMLALSLFAISGNAIAQEEHPGEIVFDTWCEICHGEDVAWSGGGTRALQVKYGGAIPAELLKRTDLTAEFITYYVRNGITSMPTFRYTEISKKQMEDLADYIISEANNE